MGGEPLHIVHAGVPEGASVRQAGDLPEQVGPEPGAGEPGVFQRSGQYGPLMVDENDAGSRWELQLGGQSPEVIEIETDGDDTVEPPLLIRERVCEVYDRLSGELADDIFAG